MGLELNFFEFYLEKPQRLVCHILLIPLPVYQQNISHGTRVR